MKEDIALTASAVMNLQRALAGLPGTTLYPVYRLREGVIPAKSVPILYYHFAFPILERFGGKCTVFVATCFAEHGSPSACDNSHAGDQDSRMLSWKQIEQMSACGVEFGSHTVSHADLTRLADAELRRELIESRETIQAHTGQPVAFLSYPFGRYNPRVITAASESGYQGACSTLYGRNRHTSTVSHKYPDYGRRESPLKKSVFRIRQSDY